MPGSNDGTSRQYLASIFDYLASILILEFISGLAEAPMKVWRKISGALHIGLGRRAYAKGDHKTATRRFERAACQLREMDDPVALAQLESATAKLVDTYDELGESSKANGARLEQLRTRRELKKSFKNLPRC